MPVRTIVTGPFQENSYLAWMDGGNEALLIDPGDDAHRISEAIAELGLTVVAIALTHCHLDHVGALDAMREMTGAPAIAPADERELLAWFPESRRLFGLPDMPAPTVDVWLPMDAADLATSSGVDLGGLQVSVHQTPGHTAGGVCYQLGDDLFTGDTLFNGSIGRTDLPGGDTTILGLSLTNLMKLPDHLSVFSGHGEVTTIGAERETNGYIQQMVPREVLDARK